MGKIFSVIVGLGLIGYLLFVLIRIGQVLWGAGSETWAGVSLHLIVVGILAGLLLIGHFWGDSPETAEEKEDTPASATADMGPADQTSTPYNSYLDKLSMSAYRQQVSTWWYDNDGDKHQQGTLYASLRFFEDGTVIGIRANRIPKIDLPDSFSLKGTYTLDEGNITLALVKTSGVDDSIPIHISEADRREMKYYGEIAHDESLIKAGEYRGEIRGNSIRLGKHTFTQVPVSKLIVTAAEDTCDRLELRVTNHPHIIDTFQDTGNWYTNGETGPEWFTLHIETSEDWEKEVEAFVKSELAKMGESASNLFWQ